jgi:general secretion pathway protein D
MKPIANISLRRWRCHALVAALIGILGAAGCAIPVTPEIGEARTMMSMGRFEDALDFLERRSREQPRNLELRAFYMTQRDTVLAQIIGQADFARSMQNNDEAELFYRRALKLDAMNERAIEGLRAVELERRHATAVVRADGLLRKGEIDAAQRLIAGVLAENPAQRDARRVARRIDEALASAESGLPQLKPTITRPVSLEFRDAPLRQVFEVLARTTGLNFVFDRDVRADLRTSIFVRNSNVEDVIRLLLLTNQLDRKILNENSLLIYPNTPAKQKEYQETVVRSFLLANSEAKQAATMLRTIAKIRDIHFDDKLNMLIVKDTPDAVRLAERLIATNDLAEPEVVLQVEVIEIARSRLQSLGVRFPDAINFGPRVDAGATAAASVPLSSTLIATAANPLLTLNLRQLDGTTNILSNPRIRVRNRDKARIHIGEKVPVFTTTQLANVGVTSSVNFLDVGLKLDVSPLVSLDDEVQISVSLEVSTILQEVSGPAGTLAYRLGTRNTSTTLRIRDNETQVLAGLISDEDRMSANRLPGIGTMPVIGRLFSSQTDNRSRTEIVLLITPRIVRNVERQDLATAQFFGGTDSAVGVQPVRLKPIADRALAVAPAGTAVGAAAAAAAAASAPQPGKPPAVALLWAAPTEVAPGAEFSVAIGVPVGVDAATARMEIAFDPKAIEVVKEALKLPTGVQVSLLPGRVVIAFAGLDPGARPPGELRFRVLGKTAATTVLTVGDVQVQDPNGLGMNVVAPPPHTLSISAK